MFCIELCACRHRERVGHVLELVDAGDVTRLATKVANQLAKGDPGAVDQDRADRGTERPYGLEDPYAEDAVDTGIDHDQVEVLESTLSYRTVGIHGRTNVDAFLFSDVCHRRGVTGIEIDHEQADWCIHRSPVVAITRPCRRRGCVAQDCIGCIFAAARGCAVGLCSSPSSDGSDRDWGRHDD